MDRKLVKGLTVRAQSPYRAVLRHHDKVVFCGGCAGITLEGFDIAHDGPGAGPLVVQIDGQGGSGARRVVIRNNVLHDSFKNDVLKINNGARGVAVQGNVFYNQHGSDEHIDVNSVRDVVIEDNVFFNDFGAERATPARLPEANRQTSSFVVVKDSNDDDDGVLGSQDVVIRRNVFLGWQGHPGAGFILIGEDGKPYYEASGVVIENNLLLGDSPIPMRAPFGIKGARGTVFRNNTIVGDFPGAAFAVRINREGDNPRGQDLHFYNNVWADPTGTMLDFTDTPRQDVDTFHLSHNLYWNGGAPVPVGRDDSVNYTADPARVIADPELPPLHDVVRPRWLPERGAFADGSNSIAQVRARLIERFARPPRGSAVVDRADPRNAPADDIRGRSRGDSPDIGAYEVGKPATASDQRPRQ